MLETVISDYTREAGVRQLERELGKLLRKTATLIASAKVEAPVELGIDEVRDALGRQRFYSQGANGTLTKLAGAHTLKAGFYINHSYKVENPNLTLWPQGNLNFGNDANYMNTQLRLLQNPDLMRDVVVRLGLHRDAKRALNARMRKSTSPLSGNFQTCQSI